MDVEGDDRSYELRLDGDVIFRNSEGEERRITAESFAQESPELIPWFKGQVLEKAFALKDGHLELTFRDGTFVRVIPDHHESWKLVGSRELRVIGLPGGDLAIWTENSTTFTPGVDPTPKELIERGYHFLSGPPPPFNNN